MNKQNLMFKEYKKDVILDNHVCVYSDYSKEYKKCFICGNIIKKNLNDKPEWLKGN